jgi:hypothetical protein
MSFVAPSTAVDPKLAALFASSSDLLQDQDHQLQQSSTISAQETPRNWKEAAPPNKRPAKRRRQQSAPVEAEPSKRPVKLRRQQPTPVEAQEEPQLHIPTEQKILELFERIQANRPGFVFLPGDMRKTLETQLKWSVERDCIIRLWEIATQSAAHENSALGPSSATENDLEEISMSGSDDMVTSPISEKQAIQTNPSTREIMTFLWELKEDNLIITGNTRNLTVLMKHQKCWQVSEERLDRILVEMDQTDIKNVFVMPTTSPDASSSDRYSTAGASLIPNAAFVEAPAKDLATIPQAPVQASPSEKQLFRNTIYSRVLAQRPEHAYNITDMLLELESSELSTLLEDDDALCVKIEGLSNLYFHYTDSYPTRAESGAKCRDSDTSAKQTPDARIKYTRNELLGLRNPVQAEPPSLAGRSDNENVVPREFHEELLTQQPKRRRYA